MLDGVALPETDPVLNLGVFLDSYLLFKEQITFVIRGPFFTISVGEFAPVPGSRGSALSHSCLGHLPNELL